MSPARRAARGLRLAAALAGAGLLVALGPAPGAQAHVGRPLTLSATFWFERDLGLYIKVEGHAHFPDGTRLGVGLRRLGAVEYMTWFEGVVRRESFQATLGPWQGPVSAGHYAVDARFEWENQAPAVWSEIQRRAAPRRPAEIEVGRTVLYMGSPFQEVREAAAAATFFGRQLDQLRSAQRGLDDEFARHARREAGRDAAAWAARCADAGQEDGRALQQLLEWRQARPGSAYERVAGLVMVAITQAGELRRAWTRKLYPDQVVDDPIAGGGGGADAAIDVARGELQKAFAACEGALPLPAK
ncbi:MAG: hypothetical protein HYZ53_15780 [Planctomycetes bacterium]|nr:hypothetical protein [Planctomycetota bacterium]